MTIKTFNGHKNIAGTIIKQAREEKKMTKKTLCEKLQLYNVNINRNELRLIEQNKLMVKDFEMTAISVILNIDLNNLKNYLDN